MNLKHKKNSFNLAVDKKVIVFGGAYKQFKNCRKFYYRRKQLFLLHYHLTILLVIINKKIFLTDNIRIKNEKSKFPNFFLHIHNNKVHDLSISYSLKGKMNNHRFITFIIN